MASFIHIGNHWINVERIVSVEIKDGAHGEPAGCRVVFTDSQQDFNAAEAKILADFLRKHGAG